MTRRWRMVFVTLFFIGVAWVVIYSSLPGDELFYHGKSLSHWLDQLDDHARSGAGDFVTWIALPPETPQQIEAAEAIRAIGTNAMPRLMRDLSMNDSQLFERLRRARQYFQEKILRQPSGPRVETVTPAQRTRWKAALALDALGPAAQSAIPQLSSMVIMRLSSFPIKEASFILAGMGPAGIAALTNFAPSPNSWQQICAVWAIGQHPQASTNLIPWLLGLATNRPPGPGGGYPAELWALGEIHSDASHVVPWLIAELSNTNSPAPRYEQSVVVQALGRYGKEASNAIPLLKAMQADPQFRWEAGEALKTISYTDP